ncbi:MAG TPA: helix-hairpin-helix domain-containing protein [Thermoanaerobaculia bacterium]
MRKSLNVFAALVIMISIAASAFAAEEASSGTSAAGVVNINTAEASQLELLPRIGAKAAQRIIEYRKANGSFKKATDLMQVKGIGDKTFELLAQHVVVEGKTTLSSAVPSPRKPRAPKASNTVQ